MMLPVKTKDKTPAKGVFTRALTRFKAESKQRVQPSVRIGFLIDATASRAHTWAQAQKIQAQMFSAVSSTGPLALRLVHFGGGAVIDHGWMDSPRAISKAMNKVECVTGLTQYLPALRAFLDGGDRPDAIILIGDMFEEDSCEISGIAQVLSDAGVKIFSFLEGENKNAASIFHLLSFHTGGTYARFGTDLPLRDLCEGVALLTAGGEKAVKRLGNKKIEKLLLTGTSNK